jgi:hypothetical protein
MSTANINTKLIDSYLSLSKNMSTKNKLTLISRLKESVKNEANTDQTNFYNAFGGWDINESAEEIIRSIRATRTFNRKG